VPDSVAELLGGCNGACVGPGLPPGADDTARAIVEHLPDDVPLLVDALALPAAADLRRQGQRCALAPNAYEAARLLGDDEASVADADLAELAHRLATDLTTAVTVRGGTNVVADGAQTWCQSVPRGLGIAGSGDVFAGITSGLLARRLPELTGLGWGVAVHAEAGRGLAGRRTNPGYLARDLLDRIPDAIQDLTDRR
jgi:NAD(P)H-hydrate repair Nnr-like enzyme with NAD(P)H-hydrate dehydratase domain